MDSKDAPTALKIMAQASTKLQKRIDRYGNQSSKDDKFADEIANIFTKVVTDLIYQEFSGEKKVVKEYANFYKSSIENIHDGLRSSPFAPQDKFLSMQNIISATYIFAAYLIKVDQLNDAKLLLCQSSDKLMKRHYLSRAVLTLSARSGQGSAMRGWFIGIAENIFSQYPDVKEIFYHDKDQYLDYLCQVDFMQFYFEFLKSEDYFSGYPNFLFYEKKRVQPLINKLSEREEDTRMPELIGFASSLSSGEFFMNNRWN